MRIEREYEQIVKSKKIKANCRAIAFIRLAGSEPCFVDGFPLQDDVALEFNCYPGEVDIHQYDLTFTNTGLDKMVYIFRELEV